MRHPLFSIHLTAIVAVVALCCCPLHLVNARRSPFLSTVNPPRLLRGLPAPVDLSQLHSIRGGSTTVGEEDDGEDQEPDDDEEFDITRHPDYQALQTYRMNQQVLMQIRGTYLGEALAKRGLPIATLEQVRIPEGEKPPQPVDWDCALSTKENPRSCLYTYDPELGTKVVAPINTTDWISLAALNRLRRDDPTKVEPMWHNKYSLLSSWFDPESEFSLLQHVGVQGFLLNALLQGKRLQVVLGFGLVLTAVIFMPVLEYVVNRILVSGLVWATYAHWYRFAHAALPLKLFLGQMALKFLSQLFGRLTSTVKSQLVELENQILEQSIPLTVGVPDRLPPSRLVEVEIEVEEQEIDDDLLLADSLEDLDDEDEDSESELGDSDGDDEE